MVSPGDGVPMHGASGQVVIRQARPDEAGPIRRLLEEAFGDRFLAYTIYRAQESARYLAKIIVEGPEASGQTIVVSCMDGDLAGYYHAILKGNAYFLNYIAVARPARSMGVGAALLADYEQRGVVSGCDYLALDVFEGNTAARAWYARRGYLVQSDTYSLRVDMKAMRRGGAEDIRWDEGDLEKALLDESQQGFGKIECRLRGGRIVLGFIGGRACRLLSIEDLDLVEGVAAISERFGTDREDLILSSLAEVPRGLPVLSLDRSLRMCKAVR